MAPNLKAGTAALKRILANPLFANVGQPIDLKAFRECGKVRLVDSWDVAEKQAANAKYWSYAGTVAGNARTSRVCEVLGHDWFNKNWNKVALKIDAALPSSADELRPRCAKGVEKHVTESVFAKVRYDLGSIICEYVYEDVFQKTETYFRTVVEPFYLAGHFPCGWDGKKLLKTVKDISTKGELIVF